MTNVSVSNLLTVKEVAAEFGVHHHTVRNWVNSGQLTAHRLGSRLLRFKREDVLAMTTLCVADEPKIGSSQWLDDDEVTTTFGTLKQSVREAVEAERERIVALLETERDAVDEIVDIELDLEPQIAYHESVMLTWLIAKIKGELDDEV
jgi:excisionase family DNA binding protein